MSPPDDVAIVGAGPAGALAALMLARAGLRVRVFERARLPRPKLCGDTLNPGALAVLARHVDVGFLHGVGVPIAGMRLSGPGGVAVEGRYPPPLTGLAVTREVLDAWLVAAAVSAGATVDDGVLVSGAAFDAGGTVSGVCLLSRDGRTLTHPARVVIAADGRRSRLAFAAGLASQPARPRRWAVGGYFEGIDEVGDCGEMHVRAGHYLGIAPVPGGLANACYVSTRPPSGEGWRAPASLIARAVAADRMLAPRFARARLVAPVAVVGPLAVDARGAGVPGLLLAGDAAGFIDPMTGDGLRLAFTGAELAATVALAQLEGRLTSAEAPRELARRRREALRVKHVVNRGLRALVGAPRGVAAAASLARLAPGAFGAIIRYAGDVSYAQAR